MFKILSSFLVLAVVACGTAEEWEWRSLDQVEQIALAAQLADYPIPQGRLSSILGRHRLPHLGGSWDDRGRCYGFFALTDPKAASGYFAVRVVYGELDPRPKPEDIPVLELQVLFQIRSGLSFVHEPYRTLKRMLPDFKRSMKEKGVTPIDFAESILRKPDFSDEENAPNPEGPAAPERPAGPG
jgi:hypothetical protein